MARPLRPYRVASHERALPRVKPRSAVPFEFVLDALAVTGYRTRPMFGCLAVYVRSKIVLVLRDKPATPESNGVWLATTKDHHESLLSVFPNMRSIPVLGPGVTGWQILPADSPDFEEAAVRACELVLAGDPRIGKTPKEKKRATSRQTRKA
jgi:hypothetical protein